MESLKKDKIKFPFEDDEFRTFKDMQLLIEFYSLLHKLIKTSDKINIAR